jgi:hypothetical protein
MHLGFATPISRKRLVFSIHLSSLKTGVARFILLSFFCFNLIIFERGPDLDAEAEALRCVVLVHLDKGRLSFCAAIYRP